MVRRILIIGGYGNFGSTIARRLARDERIRLLIGGRSHARAAAFAAQLPARHAAEAVALDIGGDLCRALAAARPDIVIHTTGPFQRQGYGVAEACIAQGCHYLDLSDARDFVAGIGRLDGAARGRNVAVISGASSVPCLSAAIVDRYRPHFATLERADYGISAAQQTNRGLATTASILSYVGRPFLGLRDGVRTPVYGWQGIHTVTFPELGRRWFGNCDVPDLALFPGRYPELKTLRFAAGHDIALMHFGLWGLSWLVRGGVLPPLDRFAPQLLRLSFLFRALGGSRSGLHMFLYGTGHDGRPHRVRFFIIARSGHGPHIPCAPAIILAQRLARGEPVAAGARPCLDLIDLAAYRAALRGLDITFVTDSRDA